MDELDRFLDCYREPLLDYLGGMSSLAKLRSGSRPDPRCFIDTVLDAWERLPRRVRLSPVRPGERTFWYALYTMEDLLEIPRTERLDPFEGMLLKNLAQARQLLESRDELPHGQFASRPNGR
jgi:hypothetical protein